MAKILIVDDMETNRELVARLLQGLGYEFLFAVDGQEAIDTAATEKPDLILMDMGLPVVDGWEATRIIKSRDELKDIPIIALTAHSMKFEHDKALSAGCDDFESKPIDFNQLATKVKKLLGPKA